MRPAFKVYGKHIYNPNGEQVDLPRELWDAEYVTYHNGELFMCGEDGEEFLLQPLVTIESISDLLEVAQHKDATAEKEHIGLRLEVYPDESVSIGYYDGYRFHTPPYDVDWLDEVV